jgi:ABC-type transport system involved in cytochrome bd biosynthesis fused ATPase/permease subunit
MDLQTYFIAAILAILADSISGMIKRSPPYLFAPFYRLWKETIYLNSLLHDTRFAQWQREKAQYVNLQAIQIGGKSKAKKPRAILDLLMAEIRNEKPTVLLGEPGSGKSASLQSLTNSLANTAYHTNLTLWFFILATATFLIFISPILTLLWLMSFIFLGGSPETQHCANLH